MGGENPVPLLNDHTSETVPKPHFILRVHSAQISTLSFSPSRPFLYSGDVDGWVAVWNLRTFRPIFFWKAHSGGVLTVGEWAGRLITHGRDNQIQVFELGPAQESLSTRAQPTIPSKTEPLGLDSSQTIPVNAQAYCKFCLLPYSDQDAFIAVPATLKDEEVDIYHLPSQNRIFRSIGDSAFLSTEKTGPVMSTRLFVTPQKEFSLLVGYEDGRLVCFKRKIPDTLDKIHTQAGEGWQLDWWDKGHREPIMGITVSPDCKTAWSIAADHYVSQYQLDLEENDERKRMIVHRTKHPGRGDVAIREDGRILAIAGWDSITRVYSAKTFKPLATLAQHKDSVYAVAFAPLAMPHGWTTPATSTSTAAQTVDQDDTDGEEWKAWLCTGGKDSTIALWNIYPIQNK